MSRPSKEEVAARDLWKKSQEQVDLAITSLLAFANHDPSGDWRGWDDAADWRVHGESCRDDSEVASAEPFWRLQELHAQTHADLDAIIKRAYTLGMVTPIAAAWAYTEERGILPFAPQRELNEFLLWGILQLLQTGRRERLHRCELPTCRRFFLASGASQKYCATSHKTTDARRRRRAQKNLSAKRSYDYTFRGRQPRRVIRSTPR